MEIVVFGAGSLGSLIGAKLATVHDVTLVGRDPHMATVQADGLRVTGLDAFLVHPTATTEGTDLNADLAIVTVKAFDTEAAARTLASGSFDAVLSLQNGMGNEAILSDRLDCPVLAGTTTYGAVLQDPGVVEWTGRGDIIVGAWTEEAAEQADRVVDAFEQATLETSADDDMATRLWEKLAVNAAINPTTALARVENGALAEPTLESIAHTAARETARTARAEGADFANDRAIERTDSVIAATASNRSSMLQDVSAGRRTEIDAITGYLVDRATDHGIDAPTNRVLLALVRGWERGHGLRGDD